MDKAKQKRLEAKGWKLGSASEFLGLRAAEATRHRALRQLRKRDPLEGDCPQDHRKPLILAGRDEAGVSLEAVVTKAGCYDCRNNDRELRRPT